MRFLHSFAALASLLAVSSCQQSNAGGPESPVEKQPVAAGAKPNVDVDALLKREGGTLSARPVSAPDHSWSAEALATSAPKIEAQDDAIAVEILKRCTGEATLAAIVDDLANSFNAPRERIHADVSKLLRGLADKKLLEL